MCLLVEIQCCVSGSQDGSSCPRSVSTQDNYMPMARPPFHFPTLHLEINFCLRPGRVCEDARVDYFCRDWPFHSLTNVCFFFSPPSSFVFLNWIIMLRILVESATGLPKKKVGSPDPIATVVFRGKSLIFRSTGFENIEYFYIQWHLCCDMSLFLFILCFN